MRYFYILLNRVYLEIVFYIIYVLNICIISVCYDFFDFLGLIILVRYEIVLGIVII